MTVTKGQVWVNHNLHTHTFYTDDDGRDYDLTTIGDDIDRMSLKIMNAIGKANLTLIEPVICP